MEEKEKRTIECKDCGLVLEFDRSEDMTDLLFEVRWKAVRDADDEGFSYFCDRCNDVRLGRRIEKELPQ